MKKIFALFFALTLLMGCDDGDLTFKDFNFTSTTVKQCGDQILYKLDGTEALIMKLTADYYPNTVGVIEKQLGNGDILYRNYSATVTENVICTGDNTTSTVNVLEEWSGQGTITIETSEVRDADNKLTGYQHTITSVNISFSKGDETITMENSLFGTFNTSLGYTFNFIVAPDTPQYAGFCDNVTRIYRTNSTEGLVLNNLSDAVYFPDTENTTGTVYDIEQLINDDTAPNEKPIQLIVFNGTAGGVICQTDFNVSPVPTRIWTALSGTFKVITTKDNNANTYLHEIRFYNVEFVNQTGNDSETFNSDDFATYTEADGTTKYFLYGIYITD